MFTAWDWFVVGRVRELAAALMEVDSCIKLLFQRVLLYEATGVSHSGQPRKGEWVVGYLRMMRKWKRFSKYRRVDRETCGRNLALKQGCARWWSGKMR